MTTPGKDTPGKPCPPEVFEALIQLRALLTKHYKSDFAYTVAAQGHVLSASNYMDGDREPVKQHINKS